LTTTLSNAKRFVIGKDHKIIATFSSKDDNLSPDAHVEKSLAIVQQLASK